jgi:hypothetical protein
MKFMQPDKTPTAIKLDERNHVEKPLLDQSRGQRYGKSTPLQSS